MHIAGAHRRPRADGGIEKRVLREAFVDTAQPWLPDSVLWRQKEQFSDGVGYNWIDQIVAHCASKVSSAQTLTHIVRGM
jgi:asparagine synthase (glutamine-hydrolysing)